MSFYCCQGASRMIQDKACLQDTHRLEIVDKLPDSVGILLSFHTGLVKNKYIWLYAKLGLIVVRKVFNTQSLLSPLYIFNTYLSHMVGLSAWC